MFKLLEMFGQRGGSDAFGQRAVKNIGVRKDIGQTFAKTGTTNYKSMGEISFHLGLRQNHPRQSRHTKRTLKMIESLCRFINPILSPAPVWFSLFKYDNTFSVPFEGFWQKPLGKPYVRLILNHLNPINKTKKGLHYNIKSLRLNPYNPVTNL